MRPALAVCALSALAALAAARGQRSADPGPAAAGARAAASAASHEAPCPPGSLPDESVCIPVPRQDEAERVAARGASEAAIPRRPDRPADPAGYVWPVPIERPEAQAVAFNASFETAAADSTGATSRTGVALSAPTGTAVASVALEGQRQDAVVVFSGTLVGPTLVTRHRVEERGQTREYLAFYGNFDRAEASPSEGASLRQGSTIGRVRGGSVDEARLFFDVRQLRAGFDPERAPVEAWLDPANTIAVDPRNVLSLAQSR